MEAIQSEMFQGRAEQYIANRCRLYTLLAESFRYPDAAFRRQVKNGSLEKAIRTLFRDLPYPVAWEEQDRADFGAMAAVDDDDIEVEFIRLFDAGPGSPPCPLVEGVFRDDRKAILKELILFYNHFGLSYAEGSMEDRPDHICYEMEFLHFLSFKELQAVQKHLDASPYIRAQYDFLTRHPRQWIGRLLEKMDRIAAHPPDLASVCFPVFSFYRALIRITDRFLAADHAYLAKLLQDRG